MRRLRFDPKDEWLEADGSGGFASGTVSGIRTRRYHALLLPAAKPPGDRLVMVNGFDAWVDTAFGRYALTTQHYAPGVMHPDGAGRIAGFEPDPWPTWVFALEDGTEIEHEIFARHGSGVVATAWRLRDSRPDVRLTVRPFVSGRDFHATHRRNGVLRFDAEIGHGHVAWRPYASLPRIVAFHNGWYDHDPVWYRDFLYAEERARGLDFTEDLASPGLLEFDLSAGEAVWLLAAGDPPIDEEAARWIGKARGAERRRRNRFPSRLHRAADAYIVERGEGRTIIAGYPWFGDWGRDTLMSVRGLCLATGRLGEARQILLEWASLVSAGMLPNRFVEHGNAPEYNSVDAALWFVIAVSEFLAAAGDDRRKCLVRERRTLEDAIRQILDGCARGTRHGIHADEDGLLAAGEPGVQLTWMDAKIGDRVVTPRIGKPVEVQALWLNALAVGARLDPAWNGRLEHGLRSFAERFWDDGAGALHDVVDVDHEAGKVDSSFRPNQILAVGGLPMPLLAGERARRVVDEVERRLLTPLGLRSLAPDEPGYQPRYEGGVPDRDSAYHQGTVWPWLMGPFVEAWLRVRGHTASAREEARTRFLEPFDVHLDEAGVGHISEIADGDAPHSPRGCPFQAWSVAEVLRLRLALEPAD